MAALKPEQCDYLAIVTEWSSYAKSGNIVGNAYPVVNLTEQRVVSSPMEEFPNPGAIFVTNRGELKTWDYVRIRPLRNPYYANTDHRNCYYIPAQKAPTPIDDPEGLHNAAVLLEVPRFDPLDGRDVIRHPACNVTPLFFVRAPQGRIYGPLRRLQVNRNGLDNVESIRWGPADHRNLLYEFTQERLLQQGLKLVKYSHPEPDLNEVLRAPIFVFLGPVANVVSDTAYDLLPEAQVAEWYFRVRGLPELPPEHLKALREATAQVQGTDPEIIRQRYRRLASIFARLEALRSERYELAREYLDTEDGKKALEVCLAQEVERRGAIIREEVRRKQSELVAEEQRLAVELEKLRARHREEVEALEDQLKARRAEVATLEQAKQALQARLQEGVVQFGARLQQEFPQMAALAAVLRPEPGAVERVVVEPGHRDDSAPPAPPPVIRPATPTKEIEEVKDEAGLVDRLVGALAAENLRFTRDFVANLYTALKTFPLNLIMGPPGYGKSSVVSALARALGHGEALLEIAVRRSWSDDRYLLGFYDAFHARYDPGPTGLVGRLLQAERDWNEEQQGIYCVLLDEFNLAAPEYYFSQLLQVATRDHGARVLQLFDPAAVAVHGPAHPHRIELHPNVRFWGTINYDETTERLSPRVLDRTGMIFLSTHDVLRSPGATAWNLVRGVSARDLFRKFARTEADCPDDRWELLHPLLELLRQQSESWGPGIDVSPRVFLAIQRYLANSVGVLEPIAAADYAFQQRVLPGLRGRGPAFTERVKALHDKLAAAGFTRSARHVAAALTRAEQTFGDIDFLAYG